MKAKDLMIGDWYAFQGHPYKCTASDIASLAECEEKGAPTDISEIPITPEVLIKNGFAFMYSSVPAGTPAEQRIKRVDTYKWEGVTINHYRETSHYEIINMRRVKLYYVHELQHALYLLRCNKEITI